MYRILRSIGWAFGGGAGFLTAAIVIVVGRPDLLVVALLTAVAGALLLSVFATALLALVVQLVETRRKAPAERE